MDNEMDAKIKKLELMGNRVIDKNSFGIVYRSREDIHVYIDTKGGRDYNLGYIGKGFATFALEHFIYLESLGHLYVFVKDGIVPVPINSNIGTLYAEYNKNKYHECSDSWYTSKESPFLLIIKHKTNAIDMHLVIPSGQVIQIYEYPKSTITLRVFIDYDSDEDEYLVRLLNSARRGTPDKNYTEIKCCRLDGDYNIIERYDTNDVWQSGI